MSLEELGNLADIVYPFRRGIIQPVPEVDPTSSQSVLPSMIAGTSSSGRSNTTETTRTLVEEELEEQEGIDPDFPANNTQFGHLLIVPSDTSSAYNEPGSQQLLSSTGDEDTLINSSEGDEQIPERDAMIGEEAQDVQLQEDDDISIHGEMLDRLHREGDWSELNRLWNVIVKETLRSINGELETCFIPEQHRGESTKVNHALILWGPLDTVIRPLSRSETLYSNPSQSEQSLLREHDELNGSGEEGVDLGDNVDSGEQQRVLYRVHIPSLRIQLGRLRSMLQGNSRALQEEQASWSCNNTSPEP
ncbi:hypothetical protein TREMEDRAFT_65657 [Tremella mesenterica DSM 1558]|uniref:uncharacterized protein n=1 Tax=Tremella mesenterica (strain ATCC 24925 / CBS 8224 / DSM 1558 / NBRC 9311 / NRRL Y-6157 / RJB 2259-6 / UBC 559-6) TaxID=578456 RepID=UPI00032BC507|nr:uncharacterized protein TREMEDRAFT_65657 [Tremella mesenterica DSM 1558]EIW66375.1 hypothetical protein TREMEDRAFT_65657 [Tremella mesenterica DSM 1558]